jgi:hypothetical protein
MAPPGSPSSTDRPISRLTLRAERCPLTTSPQSPQRDQGERILYNALYRPVGKALWLVRSPCRRRRPIRPQASSYVGRTRRLVGARLRATRQLHDKDRPWENRPNARADLWGYLRVRFLFPPTSPQSPQRDQGECILNNALHCPVGKALWLVRSPCQRRRPIRPQAGSYVGRTRRLVGARLRATRQLHDKDRPWENRPNARAGLLTL